MSIKTSSLKLFPNKIFLLSIIIPSVSSYDVLIKYLIMGKAPVMKSSPALRSRKVFVGQKLRIFLLGLFIFINFGYNGRNLVTNSMYLHRSQSSKQKKYHMDVSNVPLLIYNKYNKIYFILFFI